MNLHFLLEKMREAGQVGWTTKPLAGLGVRGFLQARVPVPWSVCHSSMVAGHVAAGC